MWFLASAGRRVEIPGADGRAERDGVVVSWKAHPFVPIRVGETFRAGDHAYFAEIRLDPSLRSASDLLGLFPVYRWEGGGERMVASSPDLFRHHPAFRPRLDPVGVAGLLLTNGLVAGRTIWEGVTREGSPSCPAPLLEGPYETHLDRLDHALDAAVRRMAADASMLLSGGRDSRLLAGYLRRAGLRPTLLTLGREGDTERECARRAGRVLGWPHRFDEIDLAAFLEYARATARFEILSNGMSVIHAWGTPRLLQRLAPRAFNAYAMDGFLGATMAVADFDEAFRRMNAWGVEPAVLRRLFRDPAPVDEAITALRADYDALPERARRWCYALHRIRYHVGGPLWRTTTGAWPLTPMLDPELMHAILATPQTVLAGARVKDDLLRRNFPDLARVPADRGGGHVAPVLGSPSWRLFGRRRFPRGPGRDRFARLLDLSGPHWRPVRDAVEGRAHPLFRDEALGALLRSPSPSDAYAGTAGLKNLLGLLLSSP